MLLLIEINEFTQALVILIICLIIPLGLNAVLIHSGNRIQLVKSQNINLILLISILPTYIYLILQFSLDLTRFLISWNKYFIWSISVGIGLILILKFYFIQKIKVPENKNKEHKNNKYNSENVLEVENLRIFYPIIGGTILKRTIGYVKAVDGVSFKIKRGQTLGLVGESGCGKSTIAKHILGLHERHSGFIYYNGRPIPPNYTSDLRREIQIVFQDPDASLNPRMKIVDIIGEPFKNLMGLTNFIEIRRRVLELMEKVSLKQEHLDRYPHEFSGGQKQRIIIARALATNPYLIVLDEPTSALDVSVQAQILNLLKKLQKEYNYAYLFITHDLAVVHHIADNIAVMYLGKFVEFGKADQIFFNPTHPYTKALLQSRLKIDPENQEFDFVLDGEVPSPSNPPMGCAFHPRCTSDNRTSKCELIKPKKRSLEEDHVIWCHEWN